jgi:hypothetical protein
VSEKFYIFGRGAADKTAVLFPPYLSNSCARFTPHVFFSLAKALSKSAWTNSYGRGPGRTELGLAVSCLGALAE